MHGVSWRLSHWAGKNRRSESCVMLSKRGVRGERTAGGVEQRGGLSERRGTYSFVYSPGARVVSGWVRGLHPCCAAAEYTGAWTGAGSFYQ